MPQYVVIRVPDSGPPALAGAPNVFDSEAEARARIAQIQAEHLMSHHTQLDCIPVSGPLGPALDDLGILR